MLDRDKLTELFAGYKEAFPQHWDKPYDEKYKWEAAGYFQKHWDIDAPDFGAMFKDAVSMVDHLLGSSHSYPGKQIVVFAKADNEATRAMFRALSDDDIDLATRIESFQSAAEEMRVKYDKENANYQNTAAISTYLWLMYPDKYYIYRYEICKALAEAVSSDNIPVRNGSTESMLVGFKLYDEINEAMLQDKELCDLIRNVVTATPECYADPELKTAVYDFAFYVCKYHNSEIMDDESELSELSDTTRYWIYSPGENAKYWDEFYNAGIMCIGWDYLGDLRAFKSKSEIQQKMKETDNSDSSHKNDATATWQFANEMKPGDIVFAKKGRDLLIGRGEVESDYEFDSSRSRYKNTRKVKWTDKGEWQHPGSAVTKTLTDITFDSDYVDKLNFLIEGDPAPKPVNYKNPYSSTLMESKNLIFRGAPGTGKTYLARQIAADIISGGQCDKFEDLTAEQKKQREFVQFHPSYDYTDFVEGLRPILNDDGTMGFELQDGIFKQFVDRARKNFENSQKTAEVIEKEISVQEAMSDFFSDIEFGVNTFKTLTGNEFTITGVDDSHINIFIPGNANVNKLSLNPDEISKMLESDLKFTKIKDVTNFFNKKFATQQYSYDFAIYQEIKKRKISASKVNVKQEELKKYIFIIDEINRGEISKIFGELFFAIDPEYRGENGEISTQYSNLHSDPDEKFYIPENVYIIGTMNDIDRSVDSFDFAMRRRFRFIELKAEDRLEMLDSLGNKELKAEAVKRMKALNEKIAETEDLNENYQIGAAYFLKLKTLDFDRLWTDYLMPLLQEYIRGLGDEKEIMEKFAEAYGYQDAASGAVDETVQDQG